MIGVLVNTGAILAGTMIGILLKKALKEDIKQVLTQAIGICVVIVGIMDAIKTTNVLILIISMVLGGLIGSLLHIQNHIEQFGTFLEKKLMPKNDDETIAWVLWHISRIEDLTLNILVAKQNQIFDESWREKINVGITDTGNALTDEEIMNLSRAADIESLIGYRKKVAERTREIVKSLTAEDMTRKIDKADADRILKEGGVTEDKNSIWLLDYWSGKDAAGILLMPPTRHVLLHLNDCAKWKREIREGNKFFLK